MVYILKFIYKEMNKIQLRYILVASPKVRYIFLKRYV